MEFFEDQLDKLKSVCYGLYKKIDEKEKQADEKIAEDKRSNPEKYRVIFVEDRRNTDEETLKQQDLKEKAEISKTR